MSWRLPLRIAARDAKRFRARSILVLVMIALPVTAVAAADTLYAISDVSPAEGVSRSLGTADARIDLYPNEKGRRVQGFDLDFEGSYSIDKAVVQPTLSKALAGLGRPEAATVPMTSGTATYGTAAGKGSVEVLETDLADPLTQGLVKLLNGRLPRNDNEILINPAFAERADVERLDTPGTPSVTVGDQELVVVGEAESTSYTNYPQAWLLPGALNEDSWGNYGVESHLVGGGPVTWAQVRELNDLGAAVQSRAVLLDPPPKSELPPEVGYYEGGGSETLTILALIVAMVLLEVVLLAGPAFAVGARQQARTLALLASAGGSPAMSRRVIISSALVLGGLGGTLGVVLGVVTAAALAPLLQRFSDGVFGPFDFVWWHLLAIGCFGLLSAVLAAAAPAWIASRQDVVAVLAGRRGAVKASLKSPVLGLVLLGAGVAGAISGSQVGGSEVLIAVAAIVSVIGMIFIVPLVLVGVGKAARRLPLALRFAARDAARHRTRTVPAVAAVAATVAGTVALSISLNSDETQNRETYTPQTTMGAGVFSTYGADEQQWSAYAALLATRLPGTELTSIKGVGEEADGYTDISFRPVGVDVDNFFQARLDEYGGSFNASMVISDGTDLPALNGLDADSIGRTRAALASGAPVIFVDAPLESTEVKVVASSYDFATEADTRLGAVSAKAVAVPWTGSSLAPSAGLIPPGIAKELGVEVTTVAVLVDPPAGGSISSADQQDAAEALNAISPDQSLYIERGYQKDSAVLIAQLILAGLGGVLMLGGTLTATFLALSDARPDLATLSAVGASPRTRRRVAAAYALVVGMIGAVLGAAVGFIPGVAISVPLTRAYDGSGTFFIDIPWLIIGAIVVALPLFTAALVGLTARSRLPLVARLE